MRRVPGSTGDHLSSHGFTPRAKRFTTGDECHTSHCSMIAPSASLRGASSNEVSRTSMSTAPGPTPRLLARLPRRRALFMHSRSGHSHAPLPGRARPCLTPSTVFANLRSCEESATFRQPTQVRCGPDDAWRKGSGAGSSIVLFAIGIRGGFDRTCVRRSRIVSGRTGFVQIF